jgi:hypothetical protein
MKPKHIIIYILNGAAQLYFVVCILSLVLHLLFIFSNKSGYFIEKSGSSTGFINMYLDGYPIPAMLTLKMPADTIVSFKKGKNITEDQMQLIKNDRLRYSAADSILKDSSIKKEFYFSKWLVRGGSTELNGGIDRFSASNKFDYFDSAVKNRSKDMTAAIESIYASYESIKLKSKNPYKNFALALHSLVKVMSSLIISYHIMIILNCIRKRISFLKLLYSKTLLVGIILVVVEILKFGLGLLYAKWYGIVYLQKVSAIDGIGGQEFGVQFNPTYDTSLGVILFGLVLIILSYLFKYGNALEKENALTI